MINTSTLIGNCCLILSYALTFISAILSAKEYLAARLLAAEWLFDTSYKSALNSIQHHALIAGTRTVQSATSKRRLSMSHLSPQTLTKSEQTAILKVTKSHLRDHIIFSLALGTGLRLAEIVGLDVGDIYFPDGTPRSRIRLRPDLAKNGRAGDIFLPDTLLSKLKRFWSYKKKRRESLAPNAPLFCSQSRRRISKRRVQLAFRTWQEKADFDRFYPFHALRHTAVTNVYRATHDLFLAQRFARHASPLTTTVYTHPSDEELREGVRGLTC